MNKHSTIIEDPGSDVPSQSSSTSGSDYEERDLDHSEMWKALIGGDNTHSNLFSALVSSVRDVGTIEELVEEETDPILESEMKQGKTNTRDSSDKEDLTLRERVIVAIRSALYTNNTLYTNNLYLPLLSLQNEVVSDVLEDTTEFDLVGQEAEVEFEGEVNCPPSSLTTTSTTTCVYHASLLEQICRSIVTHMALTGEDAEFAEDSMMNVLGIFIEKVIDDATLLLLSEMVVMLFTKMEIGGLDRIDSSIREDADKYEDEEDDKEKDKEKEKEDNTEEEENEEILRLFSPLYESGPKAGHQGWGRKNKSPSSSNTFTASITIPLAWTEQEDEEKDEKDTHSAVATESDEVSGGVETPDKDEEDDEEGVEQMNDYLSIGEQKFSAR